MSMLFTLILKDEQEFDITKFVWERKNAMAAQQKAKMAKNHVKKKNSLFRFQMMKN